MEKIINGFLPIYKFNVLAKVWEEIKLTEAPSILFPSPLLKFITYNVWFEDFDLEERAHELCKLVEKSGPDFVCLQEVTSKFLKILISKEFVMKDYYLTLVKPFYGYTAMILARYPFGLYQIPFPSDMGRSLLVAQTKIADKTFAVATSHFESLNPNESLRAEQMEIAFNELKKYEISCLMGDFNFDNAREAARIDKEFIDVWTVINDISKNPGYTMPATGHYSAWRPDKFLLRSNPIIRPKFIEIIGKDPIPKYQDLNLIEQNPPVQYNKDGKIDKKYLKINPKSSSVKTPSDHYGLEILLEFL